MGADRQGFLVSVFRIIPSALILVGHGLPKLSLYLLNKPLWGPHTTVDGPIGPGKLVVMGIEFFCALSVIVGFYTRANAAALFLMLLMSAFASGLPFFFIHVKDVTTAYPMLIVPSIELQLFVALCFLAILLMGQGSYSLDTFLSARQD